MAFTARLLYEVWRLSSTSHRKTSAYPLEANALTERLNKTIAVMLSMYVDVDQLNRDKILAYVTFADYTSAEETTRFYHFGLVHGRDVIIMLDSMLLPGKSANVTHDAEEIAQRAEATRQLARQRIQQRQAYDAQLYNVRH